jgi:hypothetical protein
MATNEMREFVRGRLDLLGAEALGSITFKSIREDLIPEFGNDEVMKWKDDIKHFLGEYIAQRMDNAEKEEDNANKEEEEEDEGAESDEVESESYDSSDSEDHPTVAALPEEWKDSFGEICWVQGQKSFPWYCSSFVCLHRDPLALGGQRIFITPPN